ncbi:hypothetical protein CCP2SC5_390007 [Azospirillaceae bacterium]
MALFFFIIIEVCVFAVLFYLVNYLRTINLNIGSSLDSCVIEWKSGSGEIEACPFAPISNCSKCASGS